jgi:hypothetical protein
MLRTLSDLPSELVEGMVCHLELRDLCNLRLTNRATEAASSQAYFKSFFVTKTVRLDRDAVAKFSNITENCRFAICLQNLSLVGMPTQPVDVDSESDVEDVLCNAFHTLQRRHDYQSLHTVNVDIDDNACGTDREVRFAAGASAVRTTLRAINESGLSVESLKLLTDTSNCSVSRDIFEDLFGSANPSVVWSRLKKLSLSLAGHQKPETFSQEGNSSAEAQSVSDSTEEISAPGGQKLQGLTNLLALCSGIEDFSLHWYKLRDFIHCDADLEELQWFDEVSHSASFGTLQSLTLRGLHVTQFALQKILMTPTLQSVHLEYIQIYEEPFRTAPDYMIVPGSFRPLLDCLIAPGRNLSHFYLDDIFEGGSEMVHFLVEGQPKFRTKRMGPGPSTVRRSGCEVTTPLGYGYAGGRALASPQLARYRIQRKSEFGPPSFFA